MQNTTNLNLKKPEYTDFADIADINDNMDTLDAAVHDTKDSVVAFTSSDVADGSATSWTTVTKVDSGETHKSIFAKMSQMFKNIRYLYKLLGTTDISSIGNGTVTNALSVLNAKVTFSANTTQAYIDSGLDGTTGRYPGVGLRAFNSSGNNYSIGINEWNIQFGIDGVAKVVRRIDADSSTIQWTGSGGTSRRNTLSRIGEFVSLSYNVYNLASVPAQGTYWRIPEGFRPSSVRYLNGFVVASNNQMLPAVFEIATNGNISITLSSSTTVSQIFFAGSYVI